MRIGIFADTHDHLDNTRRAVDIFNERGCELVVHAGDFVSTFVTPPMRRLCCPLLACWGDNDGNRRGLTGGTSLIGSIGEPPFGFRTPDGAVVLVTHMLRQLRGLTAPGDIVIYAHTHRADIRRDEWNRLLINPGETSGWTFRKPTVALLETTTRTAELVRLPELPPLDPAWRDSSPAEREPVIDDDVP
jgi:hypothetical protein